MANNNISYKHHYLPEFYLKGFLNTENRLYVFDKASGLIKHRSPSQVFYEWNRNLFEVNGSEDPYIENLYSMIDNNIASVYNKVKHQSAEETTLDELIPLIFFVGFIFWRIPRTDDDIKSLISTSSPEDLHFGAYENGERLPSEHNTYDRILNREDFIQGYRMVKPIFDYLKHIESQKINNWQLYCAASDVQVRLIGDNPIVLKSCSVENIFDTDLIFPLTAGKSLYHTNGKKLKELGPEHQVFVDVILFAQSFRYIAGPDKTYLTSIAQIAKDYDSDAKIASLKKAVFNIFEPQG